MPFEKKIITSDGIIGIWSLSDSSVELTESCILSEPEQQRFNKMIAERRRKEFLASRILLHKLLGKDAQITYNSVGKPKLKNSKKNISISHSADFATVFISENNIGIDIEQTNRKIDKIAKRFLHPKEQEHIAKLENKQNAKILYWSAKEAIFKCSEEQGIQFNTQIFIPPFQLNTEGSFTGSLQHANKMQHFKLHYLFVKNNVLVYCVEE